MITPLNLQPMTGVIKTNPQDAMRARFGGARCRWSPSSDLQPAVAARAAASNAEELNS